MTWRRRSIRLRGYWGPTRYNNLMMQLLYASFFIQYVFMFRAKAPLAGIVPARGAFGIFTASF